MFVYTIQPVVKPVVKPVSQPVVSCITGLTNGCIVYTAGCETGCQTGLYNRFDNRVERTVLFVQHGCQTGLTTGLTTSWMLFTRYSRLSNGLYNRFDNRLYRVNGVLGWLNSLKVWTIQYSGCKQVGPTKFVVLLGLGHVSRFRPCDSRWCDCDITAPLCEIVICLLSVSGRQFLPFSYPVKCFGTETIGLTVIIMKTIQCRHLFNYFGLSKPVESSYCFPHSTFDGRPME